MNQSLMKLLLFAFVPLLLLSFPCSSQLSPDFYSLSCPSVELLVRDTVRSASDFDSTIPGKLLRLFFHDCLVQVQLNPIASIFKKPDKNEKVLSFKQGSVCVQGCDGSVLIRGNGTERSDPANKSLGAFYVVESAKRLLEVVCPGTVSCADTLVLAARDSVELTGGPSVQVQLGRRDGLVSSAANVRPNMVDTTFSVDELADRFSSIGLSIDDLVVLSGAHTIGSSHCNTFSERFGQDSNGSLVPIDSTMDQGYAKQVAEKCSTPTGTATVDNDASTPALFDNQYYVNLLANQGLLHSDSVLVNDSRTKAKVEEFGQSQDAFFASWAESFAKLSTIGVKTGDEGEIRFSCESVNG